MMEIESRRIAHQKMIGVEKTLGMGGHGLGWVRTAWLEADAVSKIKFPKS